jgi:hypothetical protein
VVFAGITLGETYSASLIARNSFGSSSQVETNSVVSATLPGSVQNLAASVDELSKSASVTWSEPTLTGYEISGYLVTVDDQSPVMTFDTTVSITGLVDGEQHSISVLATNELGDGPMSSIKFGLDATAVVQPDSSGTVLVWDLASGVRQTALLTVQQRTLGQQWKTIATVRAGTKKIFIKNTKKSTQFRVLAKTKGKTLVLKSRKLK